MVQIGIPCNYSYRNSPQRSDYRSERWLQVAMHVGHHDIPATERWYRQVFRCRVRGFPSHRSSVSVWTIPSVFGMKSPAMHGLRWR